MVSTRLGAIVCMLSLIALGVGCGGASNIEQTSSIEPDSFVLFDPADAEESGLSDGDLSVSLAMSGALAQYAAEFGKAETFSIVVQPISSVQVDPIQAPWCGHCGGEIASPVDRVSKDLPVLYELQPIRIVIEPIIDPGDIEAPWCGHCGAPVFKDVSVSPLAVRVTALPAIDDIEAPWCGHCGTPFDFILTPDDVSRFGAKAMVSGSSVVTTTVTPLASSVDVLAPWCGHCSPIDIIVAPGDIFNPVVMKDAAASADVVNMGIVVAPLDM